MTIKNTKSLKMTSRFTALPLPSGEAFLLETEHNGKPVAVLVDAGRRYDKKKNVLVKSIREAAPWLKKIDIAICTHQDADHANGFRTFADLWCREGRSIGEFWLPGAWSVALPPVLLDPLSLIQKIIEGAIDAKTCLVSKVEHERFEQGASGPERSRNEQTLGMLRDVFSRNTSGGDDTSVEGSQDSLTAKSLGISLETLNYLKAEFEESEISGGDVISAARRELELWSPIWWVEDVSPRLDVKIQTLYALDTLEIIAAIAQAAVRFDIPIRWFNFRAFEGGQEPSGGIDGFLEPICAVGFRDPPRSVSPTELFLALTLSRENVESLVFSRVETDKEPGVLFLGDSRLNHGLYRPLKEFLMPVGRRPKRRIVATAPHHGSKVNDAAYDVVKAWIGDAEDPIYIRNGGENVPKLGKFLTQTHRSCAICRSCPQREKPRQVVVCSVGNEWKWPPCCGLSCPDESCR